MSKSAVLGIILLVEFGQLGLVAIQATRAHFNMELVSCCEIFVAILKKDASYLKDMDI